MVVFTVYGVPQPKGSTRAFHGRRGRVHVTSDNPRVKGWQHAVAKSAGLSWRGQPLLEGPVDLRVEFYLAPPKRRRKNASQAHITRPDLDKLCRAVKDALTGVLWHDDGQVVHLLASKEYAAADEAPRARVVVETYAGATT